MTRHYHDQYESCNYLCDEYKGQDFQWYLEMHMGGDFMDTITLSNKAVRDLVVKYWDKLDTNTKNEWIFFKRNDRSGRTKFSMKELKDNPELEKEYDTLINSM
jgi:hypothetical protein